MASDSNTVQDVNKDQIPNTPLLYRSHWYCLVN